MSNHLASELIERFGVQPLARAERKIVYKQLFQCETCRRKILDSRREAARLLALAAQLLPEKMLKPDHLDYSLTEPYVENKLSRDDKEIARLHLEVCRACSDEAGDLTQSLITTRNAAEPPVKLHDLQTGWQHVLQDIPIRYVTAAVIGALLFIIVSTVIWRDLSRRNIQPDIGKQSVQPTLSPEFNKQVTPDFGELAVETTPSATERDLMALKDGNHKVIVTSKGTLEGLGRISNSDEKAITKILVTGRLKKPATVETLQTNSIVLRGETDAKLTVTVLSPRGRVTLEDTPTFKWLPVKGARSYQVLIGDEKFHEVADSGLLDARQTEWKPNQRLERGVIYTWVVKALTESAAVNDSSVVSTNARFTILSEKKLVKLNHLKVRNRSHLELGIFYLHEGLIDQADHEFTILSRQNPHSQRLKRILATIRSWK